MWREKLLLLKKEQNDLHQTEDSGMEKKPYKSGSGFKAQASRFKKSEQKPVYRPKRGMLAPLMKEEAIMVHC